MPTCLHRRVLDEVNPISLKGLSDSDAEDTGSRDDETDEIEFDI